VTQHAPLAHPADLFAPRAKAADAVRLNRRLVEQPAQAGLLKVICGTDTLEPAP
jgi:hypothetical protein